MKSEDDIRERIDELGRMIDGELNARTDDPLQQWAVLKTTHAMRVALEWVLDFEGVK